MTMTELRFELEGLGLYFTFLLSLLLFFGMFLFFKSQHKNIRFRRDRYIFTA